MIFLKTVTKNSWRWVLVVSKLLSSSWIERLKQCIRLYVGYSGGIDSTALLHALSQSPCLYSKLAAIHVNHGLSPKADAWELLCAEVCKTLSIPFQSFKPDFPKHANIEEEARKARHGVFLSLLDKDDGLILAHHENDQAETLLLNLFRGAGIDGLAAMPEEKSFGKAVLYRPLIDISRQVLEEYVALHELEYVEDESNTDVRYSRNFIRQDVMPLLTKRWPGVVSNLNRTTKLCQGVKLNNLELAKQDMGNQSLQDDKLAIEPLKGLPPERISNILRVWLQFHGVRLPAFKRLQQLIDDVIFAGPDASPIMAWDGIDIRRYKDRLYLIELKTSEPPHNVSWSTFPSSIHVDGVGLLTAVEAHQGCRILPHCKIDIRFREHGETIKWHGQTKSLKKCFQAWNFPPWQRDKIPLIYIDGKLAIVGEKAISDEFWDEKGGYQLSINP
jgi:tRNA(Ile)-lysidine synthase